MDVGFTFTGTLTNNFSELLTQAFWFDDNWASGNEGDFTPDELDSVTNTIHMMVATYLYALYGGTGTELLDGGSVPGDNEQPVWKVTANVHSVGGDPTTEFKLDFSLELVGRKDLS